MSECKNKENQLLTWNRLFEDKFYFLSSENVQHEKRWLLYVAYKSKDVLSKEMI